MFCVCAAQLKFWFKSDLGRENSASYYRQGRQLLLTFFAMVTRWSRSTSNFYALIGQNLTGEFMRKIYAASWNLFTLIGEADRLLCQLVMFLTVFFYWMYKGNSAAIKSLLLLMASLFTGFLVEKYVACKIGNPISDGIVFVFHLAWCERGLKSLKRFWPYLIASRSCIWNGKPE